MTHLRIEQNITGIEQVSKNIIDTLYQIVHSGSLDSTSNILGRLHTTSTYQSYITYLLSVFPLLYITADNYYVHISDPEVESVLSTNWGDGIGVTSANITSHNSIGTLFLNNTDITTFNELNDFATITTLSDYAFSGCSSLTSVGLNNIISIGRAAFLDCSSLNCAISLPVCTTLGREAFKGSAITSIDAQNITTFNALNQFTDCNSLRSVVIKTTATIPANIISGNTAALEYVKFLNATNITSGALAPTTRANVVVEIPSAVTVNNTMTGFKKFEVGPNVTTIKFLSTNLNGVVVIHAVDPTSITITGANGTIGNIKIFVPDNSVSAYQTTFNNIKSGYSSHIYGLSSFATECPTLTLCEELTNSSPAV